MKSFSLVAGSCTTAAGPSSDSDSGECGSAAPFVISEEDRAYMLHYLHRRNQLNVPGLYRLFWPTLVDSKCVRTDYTTMEYNSHSFKHHGSWPEKEAGQAFLFCHLVSPRIGSSMTSTDGGDGGEAEVQEACKVEVASLKSAITNINRLRPKFVIACGPFTDTVHGSKDQGQDQGGGALYSAQTKLFRHNVCRVSDSISLLFVASAHEMGLTSCGGSGGGGGDRNFMPTIQAIRDYHSRYGLDFYGFWYHGVRCLIVNSSLFWVDSTPEGEGEASVDVEVLAHARRQEQWLSEEIDISKLCSVQIMLFSYHQWYHCQADEDEAGPTSK